MFTFVKCHHLGNDFILIDDRHDIFPVSPALVQKLCRAHIGIGADGLILLKKSKKSDFKMRLFNSDGSEASSCGNGLACLTLFIQILKLKLKLKQKANTSDSSNIPDIYNIADHSLEKSKMTELSALESSFTIETLAGEVKAGFKKGIVTLQMQDPKILQKAVCLDFTKLNFTKHENGHENEKTVNGEKKEGYEKNKGLFQKNMFFHADTGVEHAVTFVKNFDFDLEKTGQATRHHAAFQPYGVNVDFAKLTSNGVDLRVYEKGVEAETLACGTGAIATALAAFYLHNIKPPVLINFKQGSLKVDFEIKKDIIKTVKLITFPSWVYSGNFLLD